MSVEKITDAIIVAKWLNLKTSAKDRNLEFNLSLKTVKSLLTRKTCYYSGKSFQKEQNSPFYRTIDRVDNTKGYIEGNVVACACYFNNLKADHSLSDLKLIIKGIEKKLQKKI